MVLTFESLEFKAIFEKEVPLKQFDSLKTKELDCHIPKFSTFENSTSILTLSTAEKSSAGNSNSEGFKKERKSRRRRKRRKRRRK